MKKRLPTQILQEIKRYCSSEGVMKIQGICETLAYNRIEGKRLPKTDRAKREMYEDMKKTIDRIIQRATKYREYLDSVK